ncbi:MAG: hypothetical protein QM528_02000 [Phycisphaerales bacterium]|nr:hypothetical protein [Phycisphaerales bacterium]
MLRTLIYIMTFYFIYRFIFHFLFPIANATKDLQEKVNAIKAEQNRMNQANAQSNEAPGKAKRTKIAKGDYVDFIEVK